MGYTAVVGLRGDFGFLASYGKGLAEFAGPFSFRAQADRSTDMKSLVLCAVFAFAGQASGQTTTYNTGIGHATPLIPTEQSQLPNALPGVVIESWRYDPADKIVILHLVNNSGKDVTGFNISIAEKYADGSTNYVDGRQFGKRKK